MRTLDKSGYRGQEGSVGGETWGIRVPSSDWLSQYVILFRWRWLLKGEKLTVLFLTLLKSFFKSEWWYFVCNRNQEET